MCQFDIKTTLFYHFAVKIWISKNSEVPVRDQLVTQVTLGIASGDLKIGEKLPSTRDLARRFGIHQNTVSTAYRELASQGLVEFKKGSGVYVCEAKLLNINGSLDTLIAKFFNDAVALGFNRADIADRFSEIVKGKSLAGFIVIEPNAALREIIIEEIRNATGSHVRGIMPDELLAIALDGFQLTAMFDEAEKLAPVLPAGVNCIYLKANSVAGSLAGRQRPTETDLIGIASSWEDFLILAKLFLLAAKIDPQTIVTCSTASRGWQRSLKSVTTIICDSVTAKKLPGDERVKVFPLIADSSLDELRSRTNRSAS